MVGVLEPRGSIVASSWAACAETSWAERLSIVGAAGFFGPEDGDVARGGVGDVKNAGPRVEGDACAFGEARGGEALDERPGGGELGERRRPFAFEGGEVREVGVVEPVGFVAGDGGLGGCDRGRLFVVERFAYFDEFAAFAELRGELFPHGDDGVGAFGFARDLLGDVEGFVGVEGEPGRGLAGEREREGLVSFACALELLVAEGVELFFVVEPEGAVGADGEPVDFAGFEFEVQFAGEDAFAFLFVFADLFFVDEAFDPFAVGAELVDRRVPVFSFFLFLFCFGGDVDVAVGGACLGVIDGDRGRPGVELVIAGAGDAGFAGAGAGFVFLLVFVDAPAPGGDEFAVRAVLDDAAVGTVDDVDVAGGFADGERAGVRERAFAR